RRGRSDRRTFALPARDTARRPARLRSGPCRRGCGMTTPTLATDAYKFSMGQAGFPLRRETFYFSFRRGGIQYVPFDLAQIVRELVAGIDLDPGQLEFARAHGYGLTDAMEAALGLHTLEVV